MSKKIIGIDIRQDAMAAVQVISSFQGNRIESFAYIPFSGQGDIKARLTPALESLSDSMDIDGAVCSVSLPADGVSFRNMQMPFKDPRKIRQILPFELEAVVPLPAEELITDFYTLKASENMTHADIVASAIEQSALKSCLDTLAGFKLDPKTVTVGGYPAALCLANLATIANQYLFLDLDSRRCTVFIIRLGQIVMMRVFSVRPEPELRMASLLTSIQQTLAAYEESSGVVFQPDEIRITGYSLSDSTFERQLETLTEIPVRRVNLKHDTGVSIKMAPQTPRWEPAQIDNALALALTEIEGIGGLNFRRGPFAVKKRWAEHKQNLIGTGILAVMVLLILSFSVVSEYLSMEKKLNEINTQITAIVKSAFPDIKNIVDPVHQMQTAMQDLKKNSLLPTETQKNIRVMDVLNELSRAIPKEVKVDFQRMVIGDDSVQINAETDAFNIVDDVKNRLEKTPLFKKVTISSATTERTTNKVQFKLKVDL